MYWSSIVYYIQAHEREGPRRYQTDTGSTLTVTLMLQVIDSRSFGPLPLQNVLGRIM